MRNKLYRLLSVMCLVFLVSCVETKEKTDIALLKETCDELTKNNTEGRVYEPIVGRYLGSKSYTSYAPTHSGITSFSHKIILHADNGELIIYIGDDEKLFKEFFSNLSDIIGKEAVYEKKDTVSKYGICVFRNNANHYVGVTETLKKVGK